MKFENDYFRIIIEKKQLSQEQKEAKKIKWRKRRPAIAIVLLLVVAIVSGTLYAHFRPADAEMQQASAQSGEGGEETQEYGQVAGEYVAAAHLAAGLQDKYEDKSLYNYTYGDPIENVGRDEAITFQLGYDVADLQVDRWNQVFALYQDPDLTEKISAKYSFDKETGTFTMQPSETFTLYRINTLGLDTETVDKYPHTANTLFDKGAGKNWGNLGTAYLASYYDKETGELLDKPEVSIVTFESEIEEAPHLTYSITDDGRPQFTWNEVEGAKKYMVGKIWKTKGQEYANSLTVMEIVTDTTWTTKLPEFSNATTVNSEFKTFLISEDGWKDESLYENHLERYGEPGIPHYSVEGGNVDESGICVIAVDDQGTSMISNYYAFAELAPGLPYCEAYYTARENGIISTMQTYEDVERLPIYDYITMCDGYTSTKLIDYQTEKAYIEDKRFMIVDEETGEFQDAVTFSCLCIPYRVEGTPFTYELTVSDGEKDYQEADMEKDLAFLEDRESKLRKKTGVVVPEFSLKFATQEDLKPEKIRKVDTEVYANSALSEYLATNMLGGVNVIDLSEFPEAKDTNFVDDALMEAYYQNPLILGIKRYKVNRTGTAVRVVYENSLEEQVSKQEEIKVKVSEVIRQIITDDMTQQEKELATFNAYGALIDGKCVCAGYAAAFKLLAQEAGLEAIVVTGYLDGNLSHAWNKVKIDDEWQIVDVTNNDDEYFFNALLNLPSSVGDRVLVEDKEYMLDKVISDYVGESDANEYYHITDNYFPVQETAEKLAEELTKKGEVTLRTDYELNDETFYEITDAVYAIMGDDIDLYGYYWLGVIYLTTER